MLVNRVHAGWLILLALGACSAKSEGPAAGTKGVGLLSEPQDTMAYVIASKENFDTKAMAKYYRTLFDVLDKLDRASGNDRAQVDKLDITEEMGPEEVYEQLVDHKGEIFKTATDPNFLTGWMVSLFGEKNKRDDLRLGRLKKRMADLEGREANVLGERVSALKDEERAFDNIKIVSTAVIVERGDLEIPGANALVSAAPLVGGLWDAMHRDIAITERYAIQQAMEEGYKHFAILRPALSIRSPRSFLNTVLGLGSSVAQFTWTGLGGFAVPAFNGGVGATLLGKTYGQLKALLAPSVLKISQGFIPPLSPVCRNSLPDKTSSGNPSKAVLDCQRSGGTEQEAKSLDGGAEEARVLNRGRNMMFLTFAKDPFGDQYPEAHRANNYREKLDSSFTVVGSTKSDPAWKDWEGKARGFETRMNSGTGEDGFSMGTSEYYPGFGAFRSIFDVSFPKVLGIVVRSLTEVDDGEPRWEYSPLRVDDPLLRSKKKAAKNDNRIVGHSKGEDPVIQTMACTYARMDRDAGFSGITVHQFYNVTKEHMFHGKRKRCVTMADKGISFTGSGETPRYYVPISLAGQ